MASLSSRRISSAGAGAIRSSCAFAINVVALFARLRLVVTPEYEQLLETRELRAQRRSASCSRAQGRNIVIGAFAPLASFALFHLVTVFPLSWILLYSHAVDQRASW